MWGTFGLSSEAGEEFSKNIIKVPQLPYVARFHDKICKVENFLRRRMVYHAWGLRRTIFNIFIVTDRLTIPNAKSYSYSGPFTSQLWSSSPSLCRMRDVAVSSRWPKPNSRKSWSDAWLGLIIVYSCLFASQLRSFSPSIRRMRDVVVSYN